MKHNIPRRASIYYGGFRMKESHYLRTNEISESISSLDIAYHNFIKVESDWSYWKVIIIMLHNSLQGFMVCSLRETTNLNVLNKKSKNKLLKYFSNIGNENNEDPKEYLLNFNELYIRIKSSSSLKNKYKPNEKCDKAICELNNFRCKFIHYIPKVWSIDVNNFPNIVEFTLQTIEFIVFESESIIHLTDKDYLLIHSLINEIRTINIRCSKYYRI
jgi:hypothetical protein